MATSKDNKIKNPIIDANSVYEGGGFFEIKISEIVGNETAVKQLINNHNDKSKLANELQENVEFLRSELQYQNTSPFFAIISLVVNTIGAILIGVGGSTVANTPSLGLVMIVCGGASVIVANAQTIFHKNVSKWFNKKKVS